MSDFSRRSLVRGVAWTVPVVAVAAHAPAFATSHEPPPPPPVIDFGGACGNTGAVQKGCGGKQTLQVPLTVSNPTSEDIVFQITAMYTSNLATTPTGPGPGVESGVRAIHSTPSHAESNENDCTQVSTSVCPGGVAGGSILVPAKTAVAYYWIESPETGSSDDFSTRIEYRLLSASTCAVISTFVARTEVAISPANCNG